MMATSVRKRITGVVSVTSGCLGVVYVVWLLRTSVDDFDDGLVPAAAVLALATFTRLLALSSAASGFLAVHEPEDRTVRVLHGYAVSQLAKYLPGGIWQPAGQISIVVGGDTSMRRAVGGYAWGMVAYLGAASLIATGVAVFPDPPLPTVWRVVALAGLATPLLLLPVVPRAVSGVLGRFRRHDGPAVPPPTSRRLGASVGAFIVSMGIEGVGFAILLRNLLPSVGFGAAVTAFAAAWLVGVLAVPVPSGIGVREAVLVAILGAAATGPVLAASLAARLTSMVAELVFTGVTTAAHYRLTRRMTARAASDHAPSAGSPR